MISVQFAGVATLSPDLNAVVLQEFEGGRCVVLSVDRGDFERYVIPAITRGSGITHLSGVYALTYQLGIEIKQVRLEDDGSHVVGFLDVVNHSLRCSAPFIVPAEAWAYAHLNQSKVFVKERTLMWPTCPSPNDFRHVKEGVKPNQSLSMDDFVLITESTPEAVSV